MVINDEMIGSIIGKKEKRKERNSAIDTRRQKFHFARIVMFIVSFQNEVSTIAD